MLDWREVPCHSVCRAPIVFRGARIRPPHSHVFVDESKVGGYYVAGSVVSAGDVNATRKAVRALLLPKQKRIHFTDERYDRRKKLLKDFARLDVAVSVYVAKGLKDKEAGRCA